jgi:hypothetical protein
MQTVMLNGTSASDEDLRRLAEALSTPAILTEKGGYLYKSRAEEGIFHFGVLPHFLNGQRTYHYDIEIGSSRYNLVGSVNANCTLTALFRLDRAELEQPLADAEREAYRGQYAALARFLLRCGLPGTFPLDDISEGVLTEMGLTGEETLTLDRLAVWRAGTGGAQAAG